MKLLIFTKKFQQKEILEKSNKNKYEIEKQVQQKTNIKAVEKQK